VSTSEHSPSPTPEYIPGEFEGPEKTMEVCFIPGIGEENGLRNLSRKQLDFLCTEAKCSILSKISSAYMDAYVLSESSLFIYKHRYIMKTCGTTTLLHCLDSLLRFADELKMEVMWVGYSRKNLLFPTQQAWPHSNFGDEIEYLNSHKLLQDRLNGVAHILGPVTGDHWFVYVADNPPHMAALVEAHRQAMSKSINKNKNKSSSTLSLDDCEQSSVSPAAPAAQSASSADSTSTSISKSKSTSSLSSSSTSSSSGSSSSGGGGVDLDSSMMTMEGVTVNMMMFDLDSEVSKVFYQPSSPPSPSPSSSSPSSKEVAMGVDMDTDAASIGKVMTKAAGIDHLVPGATIDESSFSPCGYSMNAILHDAYSTIHVTPEPECSYASFETNTTLRAYSPLVRNALNVFRPQRFVLTMFADEVAYTNLQEVPTSSREIFVPKIGMYRRTNLSSTNIGTDLNCTMACFSLVGGERVCKQLLPITIKTKVIEQEQEQEQQGVEGGRGEELLTSRAEGGGGGEELRRVRSNTVDLTTETKLMAGS
jgi:hypothetical protein